MRKLILTVAIATVFCTMMFAQVGLQFGAGMNLDNTKADPVGSEAGMRIDVNFQKAFGDGFFELETELGYNVYPFNNGDDEMENGIDFLLEGVFNFSRFTFGLGLLLEMPMSDGYLGNAGLYPDKEGKATYSMFLDPIIKYTAPFSFGDMFFKLSFPIFLMTGSDADDAPGAFDYVDFKFTYSLLHERYSRGTASGHEGFGAELKLEGILTEPDGEDNDNLQYFKFTPFYGDGRSYAEVEFAYPMYTDGMKMEGMTITPKGVLDIPCAKGLSTYLELPISGIGMDKEIAKDNDLKNDGVIVGVGLGLNFAF